MKNIFCLTVKGRTDLTAACLSGLRQTANEHATAVIVDAGEGDQQLSASLLQSLSAPMGDSTSIACLYIHKPNCGISEGWNAGISQIAATYGVSGTAVWLVNNDIVFHRAGWLQMLSAKLAEPKVAVVGNYAMAAAGYRFVTGAVWGFDLAKALGFAENGKVLDERLNFSYQDVDLSVRAEKAGYAAAAFFGIEFGDNPYMTHLTSGTTGISDAAAARRKAEEDLFCKKHGRKL